MTDPREFSCMDDSPLNNGWGWYHWPGPSERTPYWEAEEEFIDDQYEQENNNEWEGE